MFILKKGHQPGVYVPLGALFLVPSCSWNLRPSFALKFLKWCISQQLLIRKHSYLDHSYPGGLAFTP